MYFDDMETGKIQDLFSESSFCTRSLLYSCVQFIIKHSAIIIINSTAFFNFHFLLGVTYILSYSVYFFISIVLLKKQNNRIHSTLLSASDVNSYLIDYCQNLDSIYSFRSYDKEKEKYRFLLDSEQKNYYGLQLAIDNAKLIQHIVLVFITFLQLIIFSIYSTTGIGNISFYLYPMDDANLEEVYELINIFGLNSLITSENDLFQKKPGDFGNKFSGGEKQKILIIRTLINRPHIILFDEITSSLDSNSTKVFYEMLNTRLSSSTVLFVSHDDVVDSAFDRVLEIDELHAL